MKKIINQQKTAKQAKTAITPTRAENFPDWYQAVIKGADMAENSVVRGCMVIKPWGYALWENIQKILDKKFKDTGHENAYFPLLIPKSFFQKEADHIEGFAAECAVVTHSRLENQEGTLVPGGKLEEEYIIRPTSEMIIGKSFSDWVHSYRDLPLKINQWANVMRWEMRTRMFLRTSEFLWQEGHTAHSTEKEAREETETMLQIYKNFLEEYLAIPVLEGEKTPEEKFPGAENTYTVEAMMQDKKALQAGTSHYLGQNFAKSLDIAFTNKNEEQEFAYTTSWGVSTRMIGGLIMAHSDDDGLVLPPKIASKQIVIFPFLKKESEETVLGKAKELQKNLQNFKYNGEKISVIIDSSDKPGKNWDWVRKGIPLRIAIGERDIEKGGFMLSRRDKPANEKEFIAFDELEKIPEILDQMQKNIFEKAKNFQDQNITEISSLEDFENYFSDNDAGFALCYADREVNEEREKLLKQLKVTARCIPYAYNQNNPEKKCIFSGKNTTTKIVYARAY
jgi:prolyl-tRNA synthetase